MNFRKIINEINKSMKGVTLIALVITIIVLLILAGVTINMVLGENGIIGQAQSAKSLHDEKSEQETIEMAIGGQKVRILSNGGEIDEIELKKELEKTFKEVSIYNGIVTIGENEYEISSNGIVTRKVNVPFIANIEQTANWIYTTYNIDDSREDGITIIGYTGIIPENGEFIIPSYLTINGKEQKVIRIAGGIENEGFTSGSNFTIQNGANLVNKIIISYGIEEIWGHTFSNDNNIYYSGLINLTSIELPKTLMKIEPFAFEGCVSLNNVVIPNSELTIHDGCFRGCSSLSDITIPHSITKLEEFVFAGTAIKDFDFSNILEIEACAFMMNTEIQEIHLDNVNSIGYMAFAECLELKKVIIKNADVNKENYIFGDLDNRVELSS